MSSEISIGEKIKTYRKLNNMTQEDLSKESGLYVSNIKNMKLENENLNLISYKNCRCSWCQRDSILRF